MIEARLALGADVIFETPLPAAPPAELVDDPTLAEYWDRFVVRVRSEVKRRRSISMSRSGFGT